MNITTDKRTKQWPNKVLMREAGVCLTFSFGQMHKSGTYMCVSNMGYLATICTLPITRPCVCLTVYDSSQTISI
jgi:hypothetical protein